MESNRSEDQHEDTYDQPPILTREIYDEIDDEEDTFVEMEETDEEEEPSTSNFDREESVQAFETTANEEIINIGERYSTREAAKDKLEFDHSKYIIGYREPQYKNKRKMSHRVAIIAKADENICHEFSYNRTSEYDGSKYYTCLGCRKAKSDTKMKDVIRTVRIDERYRQIISKNDPFYGHHYACEPIPWAADSRTYGHVLPQPMHMDLGEYAPSELVYVEADGTEAVWEPAAETNGLINLSSIPFYGEEGPTAKKLEEEISEKKRNSVSSNCRYKKKQNLVGKYPRKPQCYLCFAILTSTKALIRHLQSHLKKEKGKKNK